MATYTYIPQLGDRGPDAADRFTQAHLDHVEALNAGHAWLLALDPKPASASIAVGCGEGDDIDWLGAWDYEAGADPAWSPDD